jgi:hypothetical protein
MVSMSGYHWAESTAVLTDDSMVVVMDVPSADLTAAKLA